MFPIFMWIKNYNNLKDIKINFDPNYKVNLKIKERISSDFIGTVSVIKELKLEKKGNEDLKNFYSENIESINTLVGKNGSGKSSILKLLTMTSMDLFKNYEKHEHLIIYKTDFNENGKDLFLLEGIHPNIEEEYFLFLREKSEHQIRHDYLFLIDIENNFKRFVLGGEKEAIYGRFKLEIKEKLSTDPKGIRLYRYSKKYSERNYLNLYDYIKKLKIDNMENYKDVRMRLRIEDYYKNNRPLNNIQFDEERDTLLIEECARLYKNNETPEEEINLSNDYVFKLNFMKNILNIPFDFILESEMKKEKEKTMENLKSVTLRLKNKIKKRTLNETLEILYKKISDLTNFDFEEERRRIIIFANALKYLKEEKGNIFEFKNFDNEEFRNVINKYDDLINENYEMKSGFLSEIIKMEILGISDGEEVYLNLFSSIHTFIENEGKASPNIILSIDEIETYLHPEWARTLLSKLIKLLSSYNNKKFMIIIATHSPFILSDIRQGYCNLLEKNNGETTIRKASENLFASNIHTLLKNEFFLKNTIGEFAKTKLEEVLKLLEKETLEESNRKYILKFIEEFGDPIIKKILKTKLEKKCKDKGTVENLKMLFKNLSLEEQEKFKKEFL